MVAVNGGDAVAFKNPDDSLVIVLYDDGEAMKLTIDAGNRLLRFAAPAHGFATLVVLWPTL